MEQKRYQRAKHITLIGAWTNAGLGVIKIITGFLAYSHALIADGIHSISDLITDALVIIAAKFGSQKPDADHPYGHGRIETIATIAIAMLLAGVGGGIVFDSLLRLSGNAIIHQPKMPAIIVAIVSVVTKELLYQYTLAMAKIIDSNLLRANAWHHRSDVFTSLLVLIGVVGAWLGFTYLDALAAILIGLLIIKMGGKMIWESGKELVDTGVDKKTLNAIKEKILQIPGVISIHQLRTRLLAGKIFIDTHVLVNPKISVSEGHYISEQVIVVLRKCFKRIRDVTVHIDPEDDENAAPSIYLPNRNEIENTCRQRWVNLPGVNNIQKIQLHYLSGHIEIEVFLPASLLAQYTSNELERLYHQAVNDINYLKTLSLYFINLEKPRL